MQSSRWIGRAVLRQHSRAEYNQLFGSAVYDGICSNSAVYHGICSDSAVYHGICSDSAVYHGICSDSAVYHGICSDSAVYHGICSDSAVYHGICSDSAVYHGICSDSAVYHGICSNTAYIPWYTINRTDHPQLSTIELFITTYHLLRNVWPIQRHIYINIYQIERCRRLFFGIFGGVKIS